MERSPLAVPLYKTFVNPTGTPERSNNVQYSPNKNRIVSNNSKTKSPRVKSGNVESSKQTMQTAVGDQTANNNNNNKVVSFHGTNSKRVCVNRILLCKSLRDKLYSVVGVSWPYSYDPQKDLFHLLSDKSLTSYPTGQVKPLALSLGACLEPNHPQLRNNVPIIIRRFSKKTSQGKVVLGTINDKGAEAVVVAKANAITSAQQCMWIGDEREIQLKSQTMTHRMIAKAYMDGLCSMFFSRLVEKNLSPHFPLCYATSANRVRFKRRRTNVSSDVSSSSSSSSSTSLSSDISLPPPSQYSTQTSKSTCQTQTPFDPNNTENTNSLKPTRHLKRPRAEQQEERSDRADASEKPTLSTNMYQNGLSGHLQKPTQTEERDKSEGRMCPKRSCVRSDKSNSVSLESSSVALSSEQCSSLIEDEEKEEFTKGTLCQVIWMEYLPQSMYEVLRTCTTVDVWWSALFQVAAGKRLAY